MPELVLTILKYIFLLFIFVFLARAVRAMLVDLGGPRSSRPAAARQPGPPISRSGNPPDKVVVTEPNGRKPHVHPLGDELIIGRSAKCQVVISDAYASQIHARVFRRNDFYLIEDMGSTNGTYLNGVKLSSPVAVNKGDVVRIGQTELEFRR